MANLSDKTVAILVDDYFEQAEFTGPRDALREAGATIHIVSTGGGEIHGLNHVDPGDTFQSDKSIEAADPDDYDALVLPGGAVNADNLRMSGKAQSWVRGYLEAGNPVAAICHAPWLLISAGATEGKKVTSWPTIQDDLKNAGADWTDQEVCVDGVLITSRKPDDIPAFNREIMLKLSEV